MTRVAILLMHDMILDTMPQLRSEPCSEAGWWMIGPTPFALTIHQMKKVIPAIGATMAFTVKRCRLRTRISDGHGKLNRVGRTSGEWGTKLPEGR